MATTPYTPSDDPIALQELDPSPVDETPSTTLSDSYFPSIASSRANTSLLGLGNHHPVYYLHRAQRYSSYIFTAFLALHITNTSLLPLAQSYKVNIPDAVRDASRYLLLTRPYYQSWPLAEPLLIIAPLTVHIVSGLGLRLYHRRRSLRLSGAETRSEKRHAPWPRLTGTSALGLLAVPIVAVHAGLTRWLPLSVEGGSSSITLEYVSHGFALFPAASFVAYVALIGVVGTHVVWGWSRWLGATPGQVTVPGLEGTLIRKRRWWLINGVSGALVLSWFAGGLGIVSRAGKMSGFVGKSYDNLYRHVPLLGIKA